MATVAELAERYANFLLPTLGRGDGVCEVCRTSVVGDWSRCYQCNQADQLLPVLADATAFIGLAVKREQLAYELYQYKKSSQQAVRNALQMRLAALAWRWLASHESCLAEAARVETFDAVTVVPSTTTPPADHQLRQMVSRQIGPTRNRYVDLLRVNPAVSQGRDFDVRRWDVEALDGGSVLVIDDTWTTGGHAQSGAAALREAGADTVAVLAIGRHFSRQASRDDYQAAAEDYYRRSKQTGWDWEICSLQRDS